MCQNYQCENSVESCASQLSGGTLKRRVMQIAFSGYVSQRRVRDALSHEVQARPHFVSATQIQTKAQFIPTLSLSEFLQRLRLAV